MPILIVLVVFLSFFFSFHPELVSHFDLLFRSFSFTVILPSNDVLKLPHLKLNRTKQLKMMLKLRKKLKKKIYKKLRKLLNKKSKPRKRKNKK